MKIRIFNRALFAMALLAAGVQTTFAQQSATPANPSATPTPASPATAVTIAPATVYVPGAYSTYSYTYGQQTDSNYRKEMKRLQEQMTDIQRQMSKLRTEQIRKQELATREATKKVFENFDKNFTQTSSVKTWTDGATAEDYIKKKIESGEIKEKTKTYSKSYNVDHDDAIQIDNQYGRVTVNTWNKREVKVDVEIKADADNEEAAQKLIDGVDINDSKDGSTVAFKTVIDKTRDSNRSWGIWRSNNYFHINKIEVNYVVYMPAKNSVIISNRFGSVRVPDLQGKTIINISNGNLIAQRLLNPLNELNVRFGDITADMLKSGTLKLDYGKLKLGTADDLKAKLNFSSADVDLLKSSADIDVHYGNGVRISNFDRNVKNVNVDASFTKVLLNVKDDFDFDVTTRLGNFYYETAPVILVDKEPSSTRSYSTTKTYKGKIGKGNSDKVISIKSSYTQIKFD